MLFGKQDLGVTRKRQIDSVVSDQAECLSRMAANNEEQIVADTTIDNLALAIDKNNHVMDVASAIAEEEDIFIRVPPIEEDPSPETYMVRNALIHNYPVESKNGTEIHFDLFKKIVDNAAANQQSVVSYLTNLGDFNTQINEIKIGNLASIFSGSKKLNEYIDNSTPNDTSKKDERELWLMVGVAFLSFTMMGQLNKMAPMFTKKKDLEDIEGPEPDGSGFVMIDGIRHPVQSNVAVKQASKARKWALALTRIAEAVILFALIHKLSKKHAKVLAGIVVPPEVDPALKEDFYSQVEKLYDEPPDEISAMLTGENGDDEQILTYCMRRIDIEKGHKNFTPWIVYAMTKIRNLQANDLLTSLAGTSNEPATIDKIVSAGIDTKYSSPSQSIEKQLVQYPGVGTQVAYQGLPGIDRPISSSGPDISVYPLISNASPINKYNTSPSSRLGFNINDYIVQSNSYAARSGRTSDYYMHLMQNNRYTPELVCCLIKFLGSDLDFLKNLRAMLNAFGNGIGFNWGSLLEDIVSSLFSDLRTKILTFALTEITKMMAKLKKPILDWIDRTLREDKFLAFCTPLLDMARVLLQIINQFEDLLKDMVNDIVDALLSFELKIDNGVIEMNGTTRYRNIIGILDSIIFALENGQLCNQDELAPTDIHPDSLPIIDSLGSQPRSDIERAQDNHTTFSNALSEQSALAGRHEMKVVHPFQDPEEPWLKSAVSLNRRNTGETVMETVANNSARCAAFRANAQALKKDLF